MGRAGKQGIVLAMLAAIALGIAAQSALAGGNTDIAITDDHFSPANPDEDLSFTWQWDPTGDGSTSHKHNVRQDDRFFDSGAPTKNGDDFQVLIEGAGRYHYYCEVHGSKTGGMDGTVRKYIFGGPSTPDESQTVNWSGGGNYRYDVEYRIDDGKWKRWKRHTAQMNDTFGAGDDPVNVQAGHFYSVRARTLKRNDFSKQTGWSKPFGLGV